MTDPTREAVDGLVLDVLRHERCPLTASEAARWAAVPVSPVRARSALERLEKAGKARRNGAGYWELVEVPVRCPDGGRCWHGCGSDCWRVANAAPLSGYGDSWR